MGVVRLTEAPLALGSSSIIPEGRCGRSTRGPPHASRRSPGRAPAALRALSHCWARQTGSDPVPDDTSHDVFSVPTPRAQDAPWNRVSRALPRRKAPKRSRPSSWRGRNDCRDLCSGSSSGGTSTAQDRRLALRDGTPPRDQQPGARPGVCGDLHRVSARLPEREHGARRERAVTIVELGAGSGRFAYLFLKALTELLAVSGGDVRFRYVMTDFTETELRFWRGHSSLRPFVERACSISRCSTRRWM